MTEPKLSTIDDKIAALVPEVDESFRIELQKLLRILREIEYTEGAISVMMRLGLRFMRILYMTINKPVPDDGNLFECIEHAENVERILPKTITSYLQLTRVLRNKTSKDADDIPYEIQDAEYTLGAFLRALEWFYCIYENGEHLESIYSASYVASPSNDWPAQLEKSTQLAPSDFTETVRRLKQKLDDNVRMVAVYGEAGAGKSRVMASLFRHPYRPKSEPVWFQGTSDDQLQELLQSLAKVKAKDPGKQLCIVLDEDHQAGRDANFFRSFFTNRDVQSSCNQHQVVLALRSGTYDALNPPSVDPVEVCCGLESLGNYKQWGLKHAVTAEVRAWIEHIAVDEKGHLSPFLMDKICKPSINNATFNTEDIHGAPDKLRLIYSHLVVKAPADKELMHAVCIANLEGSFASLWLITAVLRAMGRDCSTSEVRERLTQHVIDGLMRRTTIDLEPETYAWSFSHDLINECILDRQSRQHLRPIRFHQIETAAINLIAEQADENFEEFSEGLAMWVALICQRKDGALPIINKLKDAASTLTENTVDKPQLIRRLSLSARYIQRQESVLTDWSASENYDAFIILAEIAQRNVSQDQVAEICKGQQATSPLLGLGHALVMMGKACGKWGRVLFWEEAEATIHPLIKIGEICTRISLEEAFAKIPEFIPRIRYAQLLMWAGRWEEAGNAVVIAMSRAMELRQERTCVILQYISNAAYCYMIANKREKVIEAFKTCITIASKDPNLTHLIQQLESNINIVYNWTKSDIQWSDLMVECRREILGRNDHTLSNFVFIASGHSHATASIIGKVLKERGIESELIYAQALSDFKELPDSCGIILVDGHLTHDVNRLMSPLIPPEQYAQRAITELLPPAYGVTDFDGEGRPGVWIAAWYPWATIDAIEYWIETGGADDFIRRVKGAAISADEDSV